MLVGPLQVWQLWSHLCFRKNNFVVNNSLNYYKEEAVVTYYCYCCISITNISQIVIITVMGIFSRMLTIILLTLMLTLVLIWIMISTIILLLVLATVATSIHTITIMIRRSTSISLLLIYISICLYSSDWLYAHSKCLPYWDRLGKVYHHQFH